MQDLNTLPCTRFQTGLESHQLTRQHLLLPTFAARKGLWDYPISTDCKRKVGYKLLTDVGDLAECHWEVDRRSSGQVYKPYYVVLLRRKKTGISVVKASSSDSTTVGILVEQLDNDLKELTNQEFITKYELGNTT